MKPTETRQLKIPRMASAKAPGLLPMHYKVRELADELGLSESTLRSWLANGAPEIRDSSGHIWIDGEEFAKWIADQFRPREALPLADDEAYCMRCKAVVHLQDPQILPGKGKQRYIQGTCETCGATLNRGGRIGQPR